MHLEKMMVLSKCSYRKMPKIYYIKKNNSYRIGIFSMLLVNNWEKIRIHSFLIVSL